MAAFRAGDVIRVVAHFTQPPKPKYLLCVCPVKCKFMVINSEPYYLAQTAQFSLTVAQFPGLEHDSFIDTSKLKTLTPMETHNVVEADRRCHKGALSPAIRQAIKAMISVHGIMPKDQMAIVVANF